MITKNHWLNTQYHTLFRLRSDGRIGRENDPDGSRGPRLWLAGCSEGNVFGVRDNLSDVLVRKLESLASSEPPFVHPAAPVHLKRYLTLLGDDGPASYSLELTYELPHSHPYTSSVQLIGNDSEEGKDLVSSWMKGGMPGPLFELGFRDVADLWSPWCAALIDGEVASLAFAARLSYTGAELGLITTKKLRGQGLAAAATAGWSRLPSLHSLALFYSTDRNNTSSRRVTTRLGLPLLGTSLRIS